MSKSDGSTIANWQQYHLMNVRNRRMTVLDLTTTYLGLRLKNPLVASASPLSKKLDRVHRLEDAGAAAIVMYWEKLSSFVTESYKMLPSLAFCVLIVYTRSMKLSSYAKKLGVHYNTAYRLFKRGQIPGYQLPTGTVIIE